MKRLAASAVLFLGASSVLCAQNEIPAPNANTNAAMEFSQTSASSQPATASLNSAAPLFVASMPGSFSTSFGSTSSFDSTSFAAPISLDTFPPPAPEPATPSARVPRAPRYDPTQRSTSWQIAMGGAFVRFRSSVYNASAVGVNSSLTYFFKDRLAIEGAITAAFAPTIYQNEHVKFVGYAAGPKYYFGHDQFEPWVHALIGGMHILPQTALSGQNGFEFVAGAGVDYNLTVQWAVRLELDYLSTHVFGQSQNNAQAALDLVFHF